MSKIYLSVVIPSFDEMANLQKGVLQKIYRFLSKKAYKFEVIIVDDGSTDGSVEFVNRFIKDNRDFRLIKNFHMGKAGSVTKGILEAKGEYVLFTDMDQATPIEEIDKLLPHFREALPAGRQGYDIVIGSRSSTRRGSPFSRQVISSTAIILRKLIVGLPEISDTQCGFKAFRQDVAKKIFTRISDLHHGFSAISGSAVTAGFDVELLFLAEKMGYKIKEVMVDWLYVETRRVSPLKDSVDGLTDLIKIKLNIIKGVYA